MNLHKIFSRTGKKHSDLTVYNREIDPNGNEHSVNNYHK